MSLIRTFVAVDCSEKLRVACGKVSQELGEVMDGARWVDAENIHLTLKFLGEVEDRELPAVCNKVKLAIQGLPSFGVTCRSIGAFPNVQKPNTVWVDVLDPHGAICSLQTKIAESLEQLGFPLERRPYKPHLTLGRTKSRQEQSPEWFAAVDRYAEYEFGPLHVGQVVVYSSELERRRPIYTPLARYPLT